MSEWTVVTVIVTLVGLGAAVIRPIISLNGTITRLTEVVRHLEGSLGEQTEKNSRSHERLWEKVNEHEEELGIHETRLAILETGK